MYKPLTNQLLHSFGINCCPDKGDECNHPMCQWCSDPIQDMFAKKAMELFKHVPTRNLYALTINLKDIPVGTNPLDFPSIQRRAVKNLVDTLNRKTADITIVAGKEITYSNARASWKFHIHGIIYSVLPLCLLEAVIKKAFPPRFTGEHRVDVRTLDSNKTRNQNIRDYLGYSLKTNYSDMPGYLMKEYVLLMDSISHGGAYGLTFTFKKNNPDLKPRPTEKSWELCFLKSILDGSYNRKPPPKAYQKALREHNKTKRHAGYQGCIPVMILCTS